MKFKLKEVFNIPNMLCYFRILIIPFFINAYINADAVEDYYVASFLILLSGITDTLDGFIARRFNMVTELGKAIDPVADKLTQLAILFCLMTRYRFMIYLTFIFLIKEGTMGVLCLFYMVKGKKIDGALWFGKISTIVFYVVTFIIITFPTLNINIVNVLLGTTAFFLIFSFVKYIKAYSDLKNQIE